MKGFVLFILRGRLQAIVVAGIAAVLSLALPPLSHVSGATVALVTLRNGVLEGVAVAAGAAGLLLGIGLLSSMATGQVQLFVLSLFVAAWLPVLLCAQVLRNRRTLGAALAASAGLALVAMLVFYLVVGDVEAWWFSILELLFEPLWEQMPEPLSATEINSWLHNIAGVMTGLVAAMLMFSAMINLCLARWWQALLFNPGGFRSDFHALRLDKGTTIAVMVVVVLSTLASGGLQGFARDVILLVLSMYSLHGLALAHAVVVARGLHWSALAMVYVLMLFVLPQMVVLLAVVGVTDSWLDVRRRIGIDRDT